MKPLFWTYILLIASVHVTIIQSDDQADSSFQDSLTSFLKSLFGSPDSTDSSTETVATAVTGLPPVVSTNNGTAETGTAQTQGSTLSKIFNPTTNTFVNTTTGKAPNQTINQTSNSTTNQTLNQTSSSMLNQTSNSTVNQPLNQTLNQTSNSTLNQPLNQTSNSTINQPATAAVPPARNSTGIITTASDFTSMPTSPFPDYEDLYEDEKEDPTCYEDAIIQNFCVAPSALTDVSFWDLFTAVFSESVLDGLMMGCAPGSWCLRDKYDYWNALIAERVDIIMNSEIVSTMCRPGVLSCIDYMAEHFQACSFYNQMTFTSEALDLICNLRRNNILTEACYKHVSEALHVSLADLLREENGEEALVEQKPDDTCETPEAHMTKGLICVTNSCPGEEDSFKSFIPWSWFTTVADRLIIDCNYNVSNCIALLQKPEGYIEAQELQMVFAISASSMATAVFISLAVCLCYRRYRRNAVIKDGYQQLLNEGDES